MIASCHELPLLCRCSCTAGTGRSSSAEYLEALEGIRSAVRGSVRSKSLNSSPWTGSDIARIVPFLVSSIGQLKSSGKEMTALVISFAEAALNSTLERLEVWGLYSAPSLGSPARCTT